MFTIRIWLRIGISEIGNAAGCLVTFYPAYNLLAKNAEKHPEKTLEKGKQSIWHATKRE
jgi:hypothetical protein